MSYLERAKVEREEKWMELVGDIPFLKFDKEWEVQVMPPFAGAIARFRVMHKGLIVSVYLDCYDKLGCYGSPYWEVYPYEDDVYRVSIENSEELIQRIRESLERGESLDNV